ncbi:MAG: homocysteine S-methyltransferase MmuM [Pseudomonadota bacterium]
MRSRHTERIRVLTGTNVDLFAVETQPRADEAEMIAEILVDHGAPPAWFSFGCRDGSTTYGGDDVLDAVRRIADYPHLVAVGVNCGSPDVVDAVVSSLAPLGLPMVAYPNHGRSWDASARAWTGEAADLADEARLGRWQRAGVTMVGGCCGVGPAELERLARSCAVLG